MLEQIKNQINAKEFNPAIRWMLDNMYDIVDMVQADYKNEKKVRTAGLYTDEEWAQYESILQKRLLQILEDGPATEPAAPPRPKTGPAVFISYSGVDKAVADSIYSYLDGQQFSAGIDSVDKSILVDVYPYILEQFRVSDYVILLVSPESLISGWVGVEHELALFTDQLNMAKFLVITSDGGRFNSDISYFKEVIKLIDQKIIEIKLLIEEVEALGQTINPYRAILERFTKRRNSLGDVFSRLKARGTASDIAGDQFEPGMKRICQHILADFAKKKKGGA